MKTETTGDGYLERCQSCKRVTAFNEDDCILHKAAPDMYSFISLVAKISTTDDEGSMDNPDDALAFDEVIHQARDILANARGET